ncbi:acetate/propionate family kinase [Anaerocaecibacter muris]|uniref:acetate/propionate family kinase n=1 Tax=Anaerocaecibacter muris TaxID=2941513 RepID=UPI00203F699A|nr:acetate kinase [Anaerocaecibacter muris]
MKVLVINAGSSSLKYQLIETDTEAVLAKGVCERIGTDGALLNHSGKTSVKIQAPMPTHKEAIKLVLDALVNAEHGVISSMSEIAAVGHRVLHSAEDFNDSTIITPETLKIIETNIDLGPLHMPPNIMGIKACREVMPDAPMVAVFDTTFHSTMPDYAYMYGIDYNDYKKYKVRKYGFHGTSHAYVSGRASALMGTDKIKTVVCHLGNGASISAVKNGKCVDTSMGLTPLEGLVMGTRSGDLDPAVLEYLMGKKGYDVHRMTEYLNKECGVKGISGVSSDFRDLEAAMENGNERAKLAIDMFSYRVKKYVGSYAAAMGGLDCLVFTGGIGEHTVCVREAVCKDMEFLGVELDSKLNKNAPRDTEYEISSKKSKVKVFIIPTNEELYIARETLKHKDD